MHVHAGNMPLAVKVSPNIVQMRSTGMDEVLALNSSIVISLSVKAVGAESLQDFMGDPAPAWRTAFKSLETICSS